MIKVFLALGSNVGDREGNLLQAISALNMLLDDFQSAPIYSSQAVGFIDQPDFLNTVVSGNTNLSPETLLITVKDLELTVGRVQRFHWGPREIDIDIIFYGNEILEGENLVIPHPRLHERDFVLKPLMDLDPSFVHPKLHRTIGALYQALPMTEQSILSVYQSDEQVDD